MVKVECKCGTIKKVQLAELTSGNTKSCGCYNYEKSKLNFKKHGQSDTRLYKIWKDMNKRCYNYNSINYSNYGGRGIIICEDWKSNYVNFMNWSNDNGYSDDLSIDRINVNGNYEPNNCRWVDRFTQNTNTRKQRKFKAIDNNGIHYIHNCILILSKEHNLNHKCVSDCLNGRQLTHKGWTFERIE